MGAFQFSRKESACLLKGWDILPVFWERQAEAAGADSHTDSPASGPYGIPNFRGPGTTKLEPVMWLLRLLSLPRMGLPLEGSKTTTARVILNLLSVL